MNHYTIFGLSVVTSCCCFYFSLPVLAQSEAHCFVFTVGPLTAEGTIIRLRPTMDGRIYKEPKWEWTQEKANISPNERHWMIHLVLQGHPRDAEMLLPARHPERFKTHQLWKTSAIYSTWRGIRMEKETRVSHPTHLPLHPPAAVDRLMITSLALSSSCIGPVWVYLCPSRPDSDQPAWCCHLTWHPPSLHFQPSMWRLRRSLNGRSVWLDSGHSFLPPQLHRHR